MWTQGDPTRDSEQPQTNYPPAPIREPWKSKLTDYIEARNKAEQEQQGN
jgi:hypothetical protein